MGRSRRRKNTLLVHKILHFRRFERRYDGVMIRAFRQIAPALVLFAAVGTASGQNSPPQRVLFVGNSLTATNDLPAVLCRMASATDRALTCEAETHPNFALDDHWKRGKARSRVGEKWDLVILQQGPSSLPESREMLIAWSQHWAKEARKRKADPAVLMVWPSKQREGDFERVSQSWRAAAAKAPALLLPAGDAWRAAWKIDPSLPLYGEDGFHPSRAGTYLAALVIYDALLGDIPSGLTEREHAEAIAGGDLGLTDAQLETFRAAVAELR